jgi:hypothetical protein
MPNSAAVQLDANVLQGFKWTKTESRTFGLHVEDFYGKIKFSFAVWAKLSANLDSPSPSEH